MDNNTRPKFVFVEDVPGRAIDWPCIIPVPQDGGKIAEQELVARFLLDHIGDDDHTALLKEAITQKEPANEYVLGKVLLAFPELKNESGAPVPFEVAWANFMAKPYAVIGLIRGYMAMRDGRVQKNSLPLSDFS